MQVVMLEVGSANARTRREIANARRRPVARRESHGEPRPPIFVRHHPHADDVFPRDYCRYCGGSGLFFCIDAEYPQIMETLRCNNPNCGDSEKGAPNVSIHDIDTAEIELRDTSDRGICYERGGTHRTGDTISGIIEPWPKREKKP